MLLKDVQIADLISEVRKLVSEHPDNIYRGLGSDPNHNNCSYSSGTCTDGSCGCIFGQAFKRLGVDVMQLDDTRSIYAVINDNDIPCAKEDKSWCGVVQSNQDAGDTWGKAVEKADKLAAEKRLALMY